MIDMIGLQDLQYSVLAQKSLLLLEGCLILHIECAWITLEFGINQVWNP